MLLTQWTNVLTTGAMIGILGLAVPAASYGEECSPQRAFRIERASDLIGKSVMNPQGERLGAVQDLAIDAERQRVAYAVLSFGGFMGVGEKWFAIPTASLSLPEDGEHFILAVEKDRLKNATGFDKDRWPSMGDSTWSVQVHEYYGVKPYWASDGEGSTPTDLRIQKATEIIGRSVQNDRGENLGEIKDLVIDPDRYRIAYVVLTFGGIMGVGDKLFAMPAGVLQMPGTGGYAVIKTDKDQLKRATGFDQSNWPNLAEPTFATGIYEFYGQRPYWTEDLRGGQYVTTAAGKACFHCGRTTVATGFAREGHTFCCAGCANKTGCTCQSSTGKTRD